MARVRHKFIAIVCAQIVLTLMFISSRSVYKDHTDIGWYPSSSKNLSDYFKFDKGSAVIEPLTICHSNESILVMIAVASAPQNFERRRAIRETWGNASFFNYDFIRKAHGEGSGRYQEANVDGWEKYVEQVSRE